MIFGVQFDRSYFQHAIVIATSIEDKYDDLNNVQIYIGDSATYSENSLCPGGPFMVNDSSNYISGLWTAGKEVWCNLKGQYTHIVANHSSKSYKSGTICALGILGTFYKRTVSL